MAPEYSRLTPILPRTGLAPLLASLDIPGAIEFPDGTLHPIGSGQSTFRVIFRSEKALRTPMTELSISEAFVRGDIDVEGDLGVLFEARERIQDKMPLRQKIQFLYDFARTSTKMNAKAVGDHYSRGDDFYLTFIDKRFRFYSHGLFQKPDETIEEASEHKLESMYQGLGLKPGMRLLDIGGGWGGVTEYCGARGVHVTTLTIAKDSHKFARSVWKVLKPGGRLYLDGSAAVEKFAVSSFTRDYVWRGTHTFMTLQDVLAELLYHGFEIVDVARETRDYELTMLEWAKRLDAAKEEIIAGWGVETYRVFRLFLWGGTHAFKTNSLQAYHLIAERTSSTGPRPSIARRLTQFVGNLR
ncbi:S-adenosyl-L-methionine-dependent methyltransferase [Paraphoma chrysanthemicola]|nr:S-adenosyl-L-methionine-dependent methyltransferase [Paraphoma chrysanthemicola]